MINKEQFICAIEKILEEKSILKHPFYQKWNEGKLTLDELREYSKQYYQFVKNFPMFVSSVHSNCPDPEIRKMLVENLADEEGYNTNISEHPKLWLNFCESLGVAKEEAENAIPVKEAENMVSGFYELSRSEDFRIGLAALLGYEKQIPQVSRVKIDGLKKFYGIDSEKAIEFFTVHEEADVNHSKAELDALLKSCATDNDYINALNGIKQSASLYWQMLDGIYVN